MKKKIIVIGIIISVFLIGIVSASLLDFFGKITGSVGVKGPVFYATDVHIQGEVPTVIYAMSTNEVPDNDTAINLTNAYSIIFASDSLGVESFYAPRFDFNVKAKTDNKTGNDLFLEVWVLDKDYKYIQKLCDDIRITIKATDKYWNYPASCESPDPLTLDEDDRFGWVIRGSGIDSWYSIRIGGPYDLDKTTHVEVSEA